MFYFNIVLEGAAGVDGTTDHDGGTGCNPALSGGTWHRAIVGDDKVFVIAGGVYHKGQTT